MTDWAERRLERARAETRSGAIEAWTRLRDLAAALGRLDEALAAHRAAFASSAVPSPVASRRAKKPTPAVDAAAPVRVVARAQGPAPRARAAWIVRWAGLRGIEASWRGRDSVELVAPAGAAESLAVIHNHPEIAASPRSSP